MISPRIIAAARNSIPTPFASSFNRCRAEKPISMTSSFSSNKTLSTKSASTGLSWYFSLKASIPAMACILAPIPTRTGLLYYITYAIRKRPGPPPTGSNRSGQRRLPGRPETRGRGDGGLPNRQRRCRFCRDPGDETFDHQHIGRQNRRPALLCPGNARGQRSEEHTSELQSQSNLVCRLL